MKMIRYIATLACVVWFGAAVAQTNPQTDAQLKRDEISKLLKKTQILAGTRQMASLMIAQITGGVRSKRPDIPETALDFLPETMNEIMREDEKFFEEFFIRLYDRHFTTEEIQALNVFYDSPVGQKTIEKQSILMQQGAEIGAAWGRRIGPEIDRRVREKLAAKGYKL